MKNVYYFDNDIVKLLKLNEKEMEPPSYYIECPTIALPEYLISYYKTYGNHNNEINFIKLNRIEDYVNIIDDNNSYILFSALDINEFILFNELYNLMSDFRNVNFVLGGAFLYILEVQDLIQYYTKKLYFFEGKGEEFLIKLLDDRLSPGVYRDLDFNKIKNYKILPEYLNKHKIISLTFRDSRCSWSRCKFCHHSIYSHRKVITKAEMVENIKYYYRYGMKSFIIYDNEIIPDLLSDTLEELINNDITDIELEIFGLRLEYFNKVKRLANNLSLFKNVKISMGLEFLDQDLLDLFDKGIMLNEAMSIIDLLLKYNNIYVMVYLLLGAPKTSEKALFKLKEFIENYQSIYDFRASFFRLSDLTDIYKNPDHFDIKILNNNYTLKDFITYYENNLPALRTKYIDFLMKDPDTDKWVTRKEVLDKHSKFLRIYSVIKYGK